MPTAPEHAIEVERLTKRYGDLLAVNDVSFHVRTGEVFAFLGPNGAGKTTTVEIISKGVIIAMGSPDELIERNANYLVLTVKTLGGAPVALIQRMGFEPVHDHHDNIKVRVEQNEGLRASMVAVDHMAALRDSAMIGVFATVVFVLGVHTTTWAEGT